jgi:hypothetical protein
MAKITFYHDTRSGNGEFPLKLRITHHSKAVHINLDIKLTPEQWDGIKVVNHKGEKTLNEFITTRKTLAESALMKYGLTNSLDKLSANDLKIIIESGGETATKSDGHNFLKYYEGKQESAKRNNTRLSYDSAIKRMKLYDPALHTRTFEDIDVPGAQQLGEAMAQVSGYRLADVPYNSAFAGYKDWFIQEFRRPGYTIEAGLGVNPLPLSQFEEIYADNLPLMNIAALGISSMPA